MSALLLVSPGSHQHDLRHINEDAQSMARSHIASAQYLFHKCGNQQVFRTLMSFLAHDTTYFPSSVSPSYLPSSRPKCLIIA